MTEALTAMDTKKTLITCENAAFAYEGVTVVKDVNFTIHEGDYLCIIGENGTGKSTLMKGLLHLKPPAKGEIRYHAPLKKNMVGYLSQQNPAQKDFPASVMEVVLSGRLNHIGLRPFYKKADRESALKNMERLHIADIKNASYRDLSGGQQQRVLLARALCATEKLLFLDEPVAGLDPLVTGDFYRLIEEVNASTGVTVVMVSHDIKMAIQSASHILYLSREQTLFADKAAFIKTKEGQKLMAEVCPHVDH
ncbi:ATP-binding cassette domain-containing protein [Christensenellaceae bacterium OttesenSCG-928-M15]|nr:ATP-binding cassette domain-containing protein [Christensenellaceae bacterium OttesenSCG-928-M15]